MNQQAKRLRAPPLRRRRRLYRKDVEIYDNSSGHYYYGDLKGKKLHGNGYLYTKDATFFCRFVEGEITGPGTVIFNDGLYRGELLNGKRHGFGWMKSTTGGQIDFTYNGNFENDVFHGFGILRIGTKEPLIGEFKHGKFCKT